VTGSRANSVAETRPRQVAVVDVGSNSVRLVVYRLVGRAIIPMLNEKVMAGLGRDLSKTGRLPPAGVDASLAALARFRLIIEALKVQDVRALATAAVREASDGPEFAIAAGKALGSPLRILSGAEEGYLSANGVLAAHPGADGVCADLGGASLELVNVDGDRLAGGETHLLGPLSLQNGPFDRETTRKRVDTLLSKSGVLKNLKGRTLYAVGGAWRAFALVQMQLSGHPLQVLQSHTMSAADITLTHEAILKAGRKGIDQISGTAGKRGEGLPYASTVLEALCDLGKPSRVVISAYGVREGAIFDEMSPEDRQMHPLLAGVAALSPGARKAEILGAALETWLLPIFASRASLFGRERDKIVVGAACRLADIGGGLHPDHRADLVYDLVLRAPVAGVDHVERTFLATALSHRYRKQAPEDDASWRLLLTPQLRSAAKALGALLRLGADLSGRTPVFVERTRLDVADGTLALIYPKADEALFTDIVRKRFDQACEALELKSAGMQAGNAKGV
jgi:exopolyphosphatase / guanosine-5'-triphosphate,3'-diphosphate pyrophosphatase